MSYEWDFSVIATNYPALLIGIANTLYFSFLAALCGLVIGLIYALAAISRFAVLRTLVTGVIEIYRNTPALLHLYWIYFALPTVLNIELSPFMAGMIAFALISGAFYSEVFRAGILSIERGQWEAGRALGMTQLALIRRIVLPLAVRRMIPPFVERTFETVKGSALMSALAFNELVYNASVLSSQTFRPLEIYTTVAIIYFCVLFMLSLASQTLERYLHRSM